MLIQKVIAGMFALVAGSAFADVGSPVSVSLADLKAKCADILANPQMVKPRVKVTCNDVSYYWQPGQATASTLPNLRSVGAQVQMKGYQVDHQVFQARTADTAISCAQFTKIERQIHNVDVDLSCEDIAQVNDLGAYCAPILDDRAAQDPSTVEETPTTETINLCPAASANPR